MKYVITLLVLASVLYCKMENKTKEVDGEWAATKNEEALNITKYQDALMNIFETHG